MKIKEITGIATSFLPLATETLKRLGGSLWEILTFNLADEHIAPGQCLSIQLDSGGISVAYGSRSLSRIKIMGTRLYPLEEGKYPSAEVVASTVHLALNELEAMEADITLIIPKAWTIVKTADFPLIVKDNLANVVSYELDRLTPLSAEKAYYDYQIVGEEDGRLKIILAALKTDTLDPYLHALLQKGIRVKSVITSPSALGALAAHIREKEDAVFLDIHTGWYEGGIMDGNRLTASFTGTIPSAAETEKCRTIAEEINPRLDTLKLKGKTPAVFVSAQAGPWPLLAKCIHAPVRFLSKVDLKLRFLKPSEVMPYTAMGGVVASLRARWRDNGMNLLDKGIHKPSQTPLALTILLLVSLTALGLFSVAASLHIEASKVEALEQEIMARSKEVKQIEVLQKEAAALEQEIHSIDRFKTSRPMVLNVLKELTEVLPKNAWLVRVRLSESAVNFEGYAASATDILPKLEASPYFKKVEFASPTFRDARMSADRFAIKMEIEGVQEEKGKNEKKE